MVLNPAVDSPRYDSKDFSGVPFLEAVAVNEEERGELTIFAVNRSPKEAMDLAGELRGFGPLSFVEHLVLENADPKAVNTAGSEKVKPRAGGGAKIEGTRLEARLPALSWNVIRLSRGCLHIEAGKNINEIAFECGYTDPGYFRRMFKRLTGLTPKEFRTLYARTHINTH